MASINVSQADLAAILQVSPRTVGTHTAQGTIPREEDGSYDLRKAVPAYLQAKSGEFEFRQQRIAAMRQQTVSQALRARRACRDLISRSELRDFTDFLDDVATRLWSALASGVHHGLAGHVDERLQKAIVTRIDEVGQDELAVLRLRLKLMLDGARDDLAEDDRLDKLQVILSGEDPAPAKPARKRK